MTTTEQETTRKALWVPGWYELDQPLAVGSRTRFWFYQNPPSELYRDEPFDFVFFNQLNSAANCQVRMATVMSIEHKELGAITQIDTEGLDYVFMLETGEQMIVNAEENPGFVYHGDREIDDWSVSVTLQGVSEPVADFV